MVRTLADLRPADAVVLWEFPEQDFPAWRQLIGETRLTTYAEYLTLLASVQADQERWDAEWYGRISRCRGRATNWPPASGRIRPRIVPP